MKARQYRKVNKLLFLLLLLIVIFAFWKKIVFVAFLGAGFYMVLISLLRTRVKGVLSDERQKQVAEKASQTSFKILLPLLLLTSIALAAGAGKQEFYYLKGLAIILSYITSLGLTIYLLTYWYFDRKTGGKYRNEDSK